MASREAYLNRLQAKTDQQRIIGEKICKAVEEITAGGTDVTRIGLVAEVDRKIRGLQPTFDEMARLVAGINGRSPDVRRRCMWIEAHITEVIAVYEECWAMLDIPEPWILLQWENEDDGKTG